MKHNNCFRTACYCTLNAKLASEGEMVLGGGFHTYECNEVLGNEGVMTYTISRCNEGILTSYIRPASMLQLATRTAKGLVLQKPLSVLILQR